MVNAIVQRMAADDEDRGLHAALAYQLALVGNSNLKDEDFKACQERAKELVNEIINVSVPWDARSVKEIRTQELQRLIQTYYDVVGDPDDPQLRQQWDEAKRAEEAARTNREPDEQRVSRLVAERDAKRRNAPQGRR